jgi:hypothetical protein
VTATLELPTDLAAVLAEIQNTLARIESKLDAPTAAPAPRTPATPRLSYSVEEAAGLLSKRPYTVREWCRNGQINATKGSERRGESALWRISADEIERYRNDGLLPTHPNRNA